MYQEREHDRISICLYTSNASFIVEILKASKMFPQTNAAQ